MSLIICNHASFAYDGRCVVEDLNLEVQRGEYLCVVGENGSGKSTLIKGLLKLIRPVSGSVDYSEGLTSRDIGYLPQKTLIQNDFPASVWEVVSSGCRGFLPFLSKENRKMVEDKLARLSISSLKKESFMDLSGGQQQRVLLARALCSTKKLLLLDEPVAGLDPLITREMYALIEELHREEHLTIIMISHDICGAISYADRVLHMGRGVRFLGSAREYRCSPLGKSFSGDEEHDIHA